MDCGTGIVYSDETFPTAHAPVAVVSISSYLESMWAPNGTVMTNISSAIICFYSLLLSTSSGSEALENPPAKNKPR